MTSFVLANTDMTKVDDTLMRLKSNYVTGWDNTPTSLLKIAKLEMLPVIVHLTNLCSTKGIITTLLKKSIISPVFKHLSKEEVNNTK